MNWRKILRMSFFISRVKTSILIWQKSSSRVRDCMKCNEFSSLQCQISWPGKWKDNWHQPRFYLRDSSAVSHKFHRNFALKNHFLLLLPKMYTHKGGNMTFPLICTYMHENKPLNFKWGHMQCVQNDYFVLNNKIAKDSKTGFESKVKKICSRNIVPTRILNFNSMVKCFLFKRGSF